MNQADLLAFTIEVLEDAGIVYMVVGSFASMAYGEARFTFDIDIVIDPRAGQIEVLCAAFPRDVFYVSKEAALQASHQPFGQFNVIHPESGLKIDFMIARPDAWGRMQIQRRQRMQILPGQVGYIAGPEDIIVGKLLYYFEGGSEKHLRDIAGILKETAVDREYIVRWAGVLGVMEAWEAVLNKLPKK